MLCSILPCPATVFPMLKQEKFVSSIIWNEVIPVNTVKNMFPAVPMKSTVFTTLSKRNEAWEVMTYDCGRPLYVAYILR